MTPRAVMRYSDRAVGALKRDASLAVLAGDDDWVPVGGLDESLASLGLLLPVEVDVSPKSEVAAAWRAIDREDVDPPSAVASA